MYEYIGINSNYIVYFFEFIAVVSAILCYKKFKNTHAKYFIWFLIYVFFMEVIGFSLAVYRNHELLSFFKSINLKPSLWWYIIFWCIASILFFLFYYHKILRSNTKKKIISVIIMLFLITSITYLQVNKATINRAFLPFIQLNGAFSILVCVTFYFVELLTSDTILSYYKSLDFYITIAIFFWWLIITPLTFYDIYNTVQDWSYVYLKRYVFLFANVIMYTTFSIGLFVSKPKFTL
ncbi:MAG: hypothetical protein ACPG6B_08755 [Oceanihabitans sp.]